MTKPTNDCAPSEDSDQTVSLRKASVVVYILIRRVHQSKFVVVTFLTNFFKKGRDVKCCVTMQTITGIHL